MTITPDNFQELPGADFPRFTCPYCEAEHTWDTRILAVDEPEHLELRSTAPGYPASFVTVMATYQVVWPCCYINVRCPAQCSTDHEAPTEVTENGMFTCPQDAETFGWSDGYGGWVRRNYYDEAVMIDGTWYSDWDEAGECGWTTCEACGVVLQSSESFESEDGEVYCDSHAPNEYGDSEYYDREGLKQCETCKTSSSVLHYNEDTERYYCDAHQLISV